MNGKWQFLATSMAVALLLGSACTSDPEPPDDDAIGPDDDDVAQDDDDSGEPATRMIDFGDTTIELTELPGRLDLAVGGLEPDELRVSTVWSGDITPSPDGGFAVELAAEAVGVVFLRTADGTPVLRVLVARDPWIDDAEIHLDAEWAVASMVYQASPVRFTDPLYTALLLHRLHAMPEVIAAADHLRERLAADAGFLSVGDEEFGLLIAQALEAHVQEVRNFAEAQGLPDPITGATEEREVPEAIDGEIPGVFERGAGAQYDNIRVDVDVAGPTTLDMTFSSLSTRWTTARVPGDLFIYLAPRSLQIPDPFEFVVDLANHFFEGMVDTFASLFNAGPEVDPLERFGEFFEDQIGMSVVQSQLVEFSTSQAELSIDGLGCRGGCPSSVEADWAIPATLTLITEVVMPATKFAGNLAAAQLDDPENDDVFMGCVTGLEGFVASGQGATSALLSARIEWEAGNFAASGEYLGDAVIELIDEPAVWNCLGLEAILDEGFWIDYLKDHLKEVIDDALFKGISLVVDGLNILLGTGQVFTAIGASNSHAVYAIDLSSLQGDDDDTVGDDDDTVGDDDDAVDGPPTAPIVDAPSVTNVGAATTVTITAGTDPEGGQVNVQCISADSNYDSVAYEAGLGAGGRVLSVPFTWSAAGSRPVICVTLDAGGQSSAAGQDTITIQLASETACSDSTDNDGDGDTDCWDADCYATSACEPSLTGIGPASAAQTTTVSVVIQGAGLQSDGSPPSLFAGPGIVISNKQFVSSTELWADFTVTCVAPLGPATVEFAQPWEPVGTGCSSPGRACLGGWGFEILAGTCDDDLDGDGWCVGGQDLNGDGDCLDAPDELFGEPTGPTTVDCLEGDGSVYPGAPEQCNGVDDDCDAATEATGGEGDGDADGSLACEDCDDGDAANFPGNAEVSDGQDNDCDGLVDGDDPDFAGGTIVAAGMTFVLLSSGTFTMGCVPGRDDITWGCGSNESPSHDVTLTHAFWMAQTETTQAQFEALMGYNPSYFGPNGSGADCGTDCPVETVSWHEAAAFANEASIAEGLPTCYACSGSAPGFSCTPLGDPYQCAGYRLPTEAEWEYAARGGESWEFAGSANVGQVAWYSSNSGSTTHPAGGLQQNAFALFDMSGNVWEWTQDWYSASYYASPPTADPAGPASGSSRVGRGGSCINSAYGARAATRNSVSPGIRDSYIGFRLSRSIP